MNWNTGKIYRRHQVVSVFEQFRATVRCSDFYRHTAEPMILSSGRKMCASTVCSLPDLVHLTTVWVWKPLWMMLFLWWPYIFLINKKSLYIPSTTRGSIFNFIPYNVHYQTVKSTWWYYWQKKGKKGKIIEKLKLIQNELYSLTHGHAEFTQSKVLICEICVTGQKVYRLYKLFHMNKPVLREHLYWCIKQIKHLDHHIYVHTPDIWILCFIFTLHRSTTNIAT